MKCLECSDDTRKYKCPRCNNFCCSFECFKKHKDVDCTPAKTENEEKCQKTENVKKTILQFTTEDTVDPEKLEQLGNSEALKDLLRNPHLREFIRAVDSSENARKAMRYAMLEPLFIEFADECLKIVEPEETTNT
ncbi:zinc finger HIT domain-containing protein 3 [Sitodiplosis mosellana]|uniref:zinc finger HIT domain-containing protein 3 n=1 Tax=Sitodiplosis mosellana TaxID=263140 RepID=UPI0024451C78|nr:zinc finger HIT domain-containing protein 3 [Sitodiplosis mosellana]